MVDIVNGTSITDAGNTTSTASNVSSTGTSSVTGSVGGSDVDDFYKFVALTTGTATFALTGLSQDIDLRLLNSSGTSISSSTGSGTSNESISQAVVAGQTYYVHVDPYGTAISNYNLSVTLPVAVVMNADIVNGTSITDAGNTTSTASNLSSTGTSSVTGSVGGSDVDDYYKFVAPNTGTATFALTGLSQDIELRLLNSTGSSINSSTSSETSNESISQAVVAGQTYYVHVDPYGTAISNYNLSVTLPVAVVMNADIVNGTSITDAGNTTSAASNLSSTGTSSVTGSVGGSDVDDYYKFVASNTGTATFALTGLSQDVDLRLLNSSGTSINSSTGSGTSNESMSQAVVAGQTYYVQVDPYDTAVSNYNLSVTLPAPAVATTSITFSELANGTIDPTFNFTNNTVKFIGQIVGDGAQPRSPVISANTSFVGPVYATFLNPVTHIDFDVGYLDNLQSTTVEFIGAGGNVLQSTRNTQTGIVHYSYDNAAGIAAIHVVNTGTDSAGFSVDTINFSGSAAAVTALSTVRITATTADQAEGGNGSTAFSYTITRSGITTDAASVGWATTTGIGINTVNAADFTGGAFPSGIINFAAGEISKTITINIAGDAAIETSENFTVTLIAPSANIGIDTTSANASGTIRNDDLLAADIFRAEGRIGSDGTNVGISAAGKIRVLADFAKAAYDLQTWETSTPGGLAINDISANANTAYLETTTNQGWVPLNFSLPGLPTTSPLTQFSTPSAANLIVNNAMQGGYYTNQNAAAYVARSGDALVLSFRGTNDNNGGDTDAVHPDKDQWGAPLDDSDGKMSDHYTLFSPLITALDGYIQNATNGIAHVYVTGHSLGGAMALKYMADSTHQGNMYEAVTFAAPAFTINTIGDAFDFAPDARVLQIEIAQDPVPMTFEAGSDTPRPGGRIFFIGNQTLDAPENFTLYHGNSEYHSMDYYRQITMSVDASSWQTILSQPANKDVLIGARHVANDFIVDGQNLNWNYTPSTGYDDLINSGYNDLLSYKTTGHSVIYYGGIGNDTFNGGSDNELMLGGTGIDTALYQINRSLSTLTKTTTGFTVSSAVDGSDTLVSIERLKFADTSVALDITGNAGTTAKILGAVFGKESIAIKGYVGIGLDKLDNGMSYQDLMLLALNAKLGSGFSIASEVTLLYQNLAGVAPSADNLSFWTNAINTGQYTQASLGVMAADLSLNTNNINLVGLAQTGVEYV